jgi:hypothetical protein
MRHKQLMMDVIKRGRTQRQHVETRSRPRLFAASLAAFPSMSLIPSAPFCEQMELIARRGLPA